MRPSAHHAAMCGVRGILDDLGSRQPAASHEQPPEIGASFGHVKCMSRVEDDTLNSLSAYVRQRICLTARPDASMSKVEMLGVIDDAISSDPLVSLHAPVDSDTCVRLGPQHRKKCFLRCVRSKVGMLACTDTERLALSAIDKSSPQCGDQRSRHPSASASQTSCAPELG